MVESQRFSGDVGRHSFLKNSFEKRVGRRKVVNDQDVLDGVKLDDLSYTLAMYQPENAMLAMEAMRMIFGEQGDVSGWREALSQVKWEGRMEEILPDFYVDGAHNVSAVRMFVQSIQRDRREKVVLFSAVREKNYEEMIRILCQEKSVSEYVITLIEDKRAAQTEELKQIFQKYTDKPVVVKEELHQALTYLFSRKAGKAVYCLGSLYLTGMIKAITEEAG